MESQRLHPLGRLIAGLAAGVLLAIAVEAVRRGTRWSAIVPLAFFVALLSYAAVTGRWVRLFGRSSR